MVPHGTVEQRVIELFNLDSSEAQPVCVVGIPDESKGEALVLLSAVDLSLESIRQKLTEAGLPNLWIPKRENFFQVESIPFLGSGKLDLKGIKALAQGQMKVDV